MIVELNTEELKAVVGGSMASPHVAAKKAKESQKVAAKKEKAAEKKLKAMVGRSNGSGTMS
jgi:bacteriocin-like protein